MLLRWSGQLDHGRSVHMTASRPLVTSCSASSRTTTQSGPRDNLYFARAAVARLWHRSTMFTVACISSFGSRSVILDGARYKGRLTENFEKRSDTYDSPNAIHKPFCNYMLNMAEIQPGHAVLDAACGTGHISLPAAAAVGPSGSMYANMLPVSQELCPRGGRVTGVDLSAGMIAKAKIKAAQQALTLIDFLVGDLEDIDLPSDVFDIIFVANAFAYIADVPALLRRMHAWLKPGGRLIGNNPQAPMLRSSAPFYELLAEMFQIHLDCPAAELGSADRFAAALKGAGFSTVKVHETQEKVVEPNTTADSYVSKMFDMHMTFPNTNLSSILTEQQQMEMRPVYHDRFLPVANTLHQDNNIINPCTMLWADARR